MLAIDTFVVVVQNAENDAEPAFVMKHEQAVDFCTEAGSIFCEGVEIRQFTQPAPKLYYFREMIFPGARKSFRSVFIVGQLQKPIDVLDRHPESIRANP